MGPPIELPAGMGCVWSDERKAWSLTLSVGPGKKYGMIMLPSNTPAEWRKAVADIQAAAGVGTNGGR